MKKPSISVLFLDCDGVVNGHRVLKAAGCCGIDPKCIRHLNRVLDATGCKIVVSSAWRYMILAKAMRLDGFWYMLRTHGLTNRGRGNPFVGVTRKDADPTRDERGEQIRAWLRDWKARGGSRVRRYAAVDDLDIGITKARVPLVLTDGKVGLTAADADRLIELLGQRGEAE